MGVSRRRLLAVAGSALGTLLAAGCTAPRDPDRILALGDSYTVGTGVPEDERWITELVEGWRSEGLTVRDPLVVAEAGWTTDDLLAATRGLSRDRDDDLVTLLIGANDAFEGRPVGAFRPRFGKLLERAVAVAGDDPGAVVVMTIPDYTVTPYGSRFSPQTHADRLGRYNDAIREDAEAAGTHLVDLVPPSRAVASDADLVADDGLHPSPAQYELWLDRIAPVATQALTE